MPGPGASARRAGHDFERAVATYLDTITTRNHAPGAHLDMGDVLIDDWLVECKNHAKPALRSWWEIVVAKAAVHHRYPALVVNRRNHPLGSSDVYLTIDDLIHLCQTTAHPQLSEPICHITLVTFRELLDIDLKAHP